MSSIVAFVFGLLSGRPVECVLEGSFGKQAWMKRAAASRYDPWKKSVALLPGAILIFILLGGCAPNTVPLTPAQTALPPAATEPLPTSALPTATLISASPTQASTTTPLPPPAKATSATDASVTTVTSPLKATSAVTSAPGAVKATPVPAQSVSCNTIVPSRLSVGQTARVLKRVNVRKDASIRAAIVTVNPANTQVEIIGGPVCEVVGKGAYLWWQIRLPDGTEGWSAEAPIRTRSYFLEPAS
jgi:hypothetical protein